MEVVTARRQPAVRRTVILGTGASVVAETADRVYGAVTALAGLSEREFQAIVVAELRRMGFTAWVVPNMRLTTAGLPDVIAWHPRLPGLLLALELKREKDYRVTPAQTSALAHLATVPGIEARILRPSGWERLRDTLAFMLAHDGRGATGEGQS